MQRQADVAGMVVMLLACRWLDGLRLHGAWVFRSCRWCCGSLIVAAVSVAAQPGIAFQAGGALGGADVLRRWWRADALGGRLWRAGFGLVGLAVLLTVGIILVSGAGATATAGHLRSDRRSDRRAVLREDRLRERVRQAALVRDERRRRWLNGRSAVAQRRASQMAFHGLSAASSQRLLNRDYGRMLAGVTANPAASIARGGHVVRYLDDHRAVVRRGGKLLLETSTTPLRIKSPSGIERPVDLRLVPASNAFTPTNSIVPLSIGSQITEGVAVGSDGLRVIPETGSATGVPVAGLSVFYPNAGPDMDVVAAPTVNGAELFATLRSRMSPEQLRYRVVLPAGAMLGPDGAGGAVVSRAGVTLADPGAERPGRPGFVDRRDDGGSGRRTGP